MTVGAPAHVYSLRKRTQKLPFLCPIDFDPLSVLPIGVYLYSYARGEISLGGKVRNRN